MQFIVPATERFRCWLFLMERGGVGAAALVVEVSATCQSISSSTWQVDFPSFYRPNARPKATSQAQTSPSKPWGLIAAGT